MQSLKGQALAVTTAFPPDTTWEKLLQALKIKYQEKAPYDVIMAQFYGTQMEPDENCASFGTRLEQKLNQVTLQYPNKISDTMYWNCVRERFFHGLSKNMRTNLRPQFDGGANYYKLLELARMIESENFYEDAKTEAKPTNQKDKAKVDVVTIDNTAQQIQQLQGAVKGLTKLIQGSRQNTQPQQIPHFVPQLVQDNPNILPQASQNQNPAPPQGGRGSREIKQMLESEKNSSKSTSVDDTSHTFVPTPNVRNGFRRKKGDSPFVYNLNLKVKKEKKQSNYTNPDPWARIVGSRNTAAIYMDGIATTALFDTGAEIQLVGKQFCEENNLEIQPIEKLTECSTMNGEVFGYEGFVEVNVQIPGRDFSENHLLFVTSEISHQKEIPVVLGTYFIDSLSRYLHGIDKEEFDSLDYTVKQAYLSWVEAARIREKYGCEPPLGVVRTTKPVTIYAGERKEIHGKTKIKHGGYSVNCISEPAIEKALPKGLKLITGYSLLGAGSSRVSNVI